MGQELVAHKVWQCNICNEIIPDGNMARHMLDKHKIGWVVIGSDVIYADPYEQTSGAKIIKPEK